MVVDIHSHILHGIDDGSIDFEMTKEMIKLSYEEGCRHLFLTPHAASIKKKKFIDNKICEINDWLLKESIDINVYLGAEIYLDSEDSESVASVLRKVKKGIYPTLNHTEYLLIEFYFGGFVFEDIIPIVAKIINAGYKPVIAHAEKYGVGINILSKLKDVGCKLQIYLSDVCGEYSHEMVDMANKLLELKMVDFVGTDAHRIDRRRPEIKEYTDYLYTNFSKEYIDKILFKNAFELLQIES